MLNAERRTFRCGPQGWPVERPSLRLNPNGGVIEHSWTGDAEQELMQILRLLRDPIDRLPDALELSRQAEPISATPPYRGSGRAPPSMCPALCGLVDRLADAGALYFTAGQKEADLAQIAAVLRGHPRLA